VLSQHTFKRISQKGRKKIMSKMIQKLREFKIRKACKSQGKAKIALNRIDRIYKHVLKIGHNAKKYNLSIKIKV
jgi:hypothetical protein